MLYTVEQLFEPHVKHTHTLENCIKFQKLSIIVIRVVCSEMSLFISRFHDCGLSPQVHTDNSALCEWNEYTYAKYSPCVLYLLLMVCIHLIPKHFDRFFFVRYIVFTSSARLVVCCLNKNLL